MGCEHITCHGLASDAGKTFSAVTCPALPSLAQDSDGHTPTIAELNSVLGPLRGQCISMVGGASLHWVHET